MLFKRINRDLPEQVFVAVQANEGSALTKDQVVQMDIGTAIDGVKVVQPNTGELYAFVGVADQAIADQDYGLAQVYGYRSSSILFQTATTMAAGLPLVPTAGQNYMQTTASSYTFASNTTISVTQVPYMAVLAETVTSVAASTTASAKIFIRGL